jgi:hypothetical protein
MDYKSRLRSVRQNNPPQEAKKLAVAATPVGFISLITQIQMGDWPYVLAMLAALLKDFLNPFEVTGILYILIVVLTFCTSIFIFFMMLLGSFSEGGGRSARRKGKQSAAMMKRGLVLMGGTVVDLLPGINFIPWEFITVLIIYGMVLMARKQAKEE